jgi:hypothetical protein
MADQSLLTDEIRAYIGRATEPVPVTVTQEAVFRAIEAYEGRHERVMAPGMPVPGFVLLNILPGGDDIRLPDPLPKSLLVSNEFAVERPIVLGEELMARSRVADISERLGGQFGHGIYVRTEVEFTGSDGEVAGRAASTLMYYDPAGARRREEAPQ